MLEATLQNRPRWMKIVAIVLAIVAILIGFMLGGGYVKAAGLVREGDALMAEGKYEEAKAAYKEAEHYWPPRREELARKLQAAEEALKASTAVAVSVSEPAPEQPATTESTATATPATKKKAATKSSSGTTASTSTSSEPSTESTPTSSGSTDSPSSGSSGSDSSGSSGGSSGSSGSSGGSSDSGSTTPAEPTPPVLKNLGVAFAPYDSVTGRAGAFDFLSLQSKPFIPFGDNGTEPTFTFLTAEDADVTAVADGYIQAVTYQGTYSDYSIVANTEADNGGYTIDYDHILSPTVSVGDQVSAGKVLGKVGTHSDVGVGRVEIMVFLGGQSITSYCPFTYFDSSLRATYESKLATLMSDYESFNHNTGYYDESADDAYYTGCLARTAGG
ncbi:peptidoglycan DD-metalloendopeptidase family protein [Candidatus Berkelbacteria bacterium]|nr:peptidoglycan DD-metalloendopeptidase family protein [Candidatus Berkelbacteria bacterium]